MPEYPPVKNKKNFVARYMEGEFGNRSPTWGTLEEFLEEKKHKRPHGYDYSPGNFHLRNRVTSGDTWYDLSSEQVEECWNLAADDKGLKPEDLYISEMAPTDRTTLQGEIQQTDRGTELYGTNVRLPMRDALRLSAFTLTGLQAVSSLVRYCDANSLEWINILLARYPGHVIEFSSYNRSWGTVPNRNTVIWEVRLY